MDGSFRCRKCGCFLFTAEHLVSKQKIEDDESVGFTQWFLKHDAACPDWAEQAILKEQYTRGKLICPKCMGRVGAFDFVGKREHYQLGPVWIQKCRVDLIRRILIQPVPQRSRVQLPFVTTSSEMPKLTSGESVKTGSRDLTLRGATLSPVGGAWASVSSSSSSSTASDERCHKNEQSLNCDVMTMLSDVTSLQQDGCLTSISMKSHMSSEATAQTEAPPKQVDDNGPTESEVETAYTCPICLDILFQAHTCRPCLHVYCAPCLRRLSGASPFSTRCPLCRQVIAACLPNHEMSNIVRSVFPKEYNLRNVLEKKSRKTLPALPSSGTFTLTNFNRDRNRNYVFPHWAGVCFVILLIVMAISVMATTIGMILWYLWETFMDYFIDGLVSINGYFDYSWQLIIMILLEKSDEISPEVAKMLAGSFGQVLHAVGKLFNRTVETPLDHRVPPSGETEKSTASESATEMNYVISAFQVDLANYVLVMCVVTYLIYRFARYRQARQVEATQLR